MSGVQGAGSTLRNGCARRQQHAALARNRPRDPIGRPRDPIGWRTCPRCPPEDNLWPVEAFDAWRAANNGKPAAPCCAACLFAGYPRVYRPCVTCGGVMAYHPKRAHIERGQCMKCKPLPTCTRCKADLRGRATVELDQPRAPTCDDKPRRGRPPTVRRDPFCPGCAERQAHTSPELAAPPA